MRVIRVRADLYRFFSCLLSYPLPRELLFTQEDLFVFFSTHLPCDLVRIEQQIKRISDLNIEYLD